MVGQLAEIDKIVYYTEASILDASPMNVSARLVYQVYIKFHGISGWREMGQLVELLT